MVNLCAYGFGEYQPIVIEEDKKASLHEKAENETRSKLYNLAIEVSFPLLERYGHVIVLDER